MAPIQNLAIQFENTPISPRVTLNLKILLDPACDSHFPKGVSGLSPVFPIVVPLIPCFNSVDSVNTFLSFDTGTSAATKDF